jgi:hypothetical protein
MRVRLFISAIVIGICGASATAALASHPHVRAGLYAPSASETTLDHYSNGGVNLIVAKGSKKITLAGVACYTGSAPTGGLPANDEVKIDVPHALPISSSGSFSFSGPVTLTPEDSQTESSFTTTFTIKGHFQSGKIAVVGTDSSPICQPQTITRMRLRYAPEA